MVIDIILQIYNVLSPAERKKGFVAIILILSNALLDVFSLASILPFILLALDSSIIQSNYYVSLMYHSLGFESENQFLIVIALVILLLFVLKNVLSLLITHFQSRFAYDVATNLSERQFTGYLSKNYLSFTGSNSSFLARNILHIPVEFSVHVLLATITFLSDSIAFLFIAIAIAIYDFQIFLLLSLILGPPFLILYHRKKTKLSEIGRRSKELQPLSMKHLFHGIDGYIDVKLHNKETYFVKKFADSQKKLNRNWALFHTVNSLPTRLIEVTAVLGVVIVWIYTLLFSQTRNEMIVLLSLFTAAAYRVMPSINRMFTSLINIKTFRHTIDVLQEVDGTVEVSPSNVATQATRNSFNEYVAFRNVSFSYPDSASFILKNVNFVVRKGESVGFIGKSGSGKTTLINIFLRFLREQSGEIVVDGMPLRAEDTIAWRSLIGHVQQNPIMLDGSIVENIAFGEDREQINLEKLRVAVQKAGLADFVTGLPHGVETQVGEQGTRLSGGQRQRLAIARAVYRNSEILVFDQATSELDDQTEREITDAIRTLSEQNQTILIIAHRITTLKHCDRIYCLDDGQITRMFRYPEMLERELT